MMSRYSGYQKLTQFGMLFELFAPDFRRISGQKNAQKKVFRMAATE